MDFRKVGVCDNVRRKIARITAQSKKLAIAAATLTRRVDMRKRSIDDLQL